MKKLNNKTIVISGASRGIGLSIACRMAREGANIAILAKTIEPHPKLEGTIYTAAQEIEKQGGKALPLAVDMRDEQAIDKAILYIVKTFGGIDIVVNNASAIALTQTADTKIKQYDLMQDINVRGSFMLVRSCIEFLKKSDNPHILSLSPPLNMSPKWFGKHVAYTLSKYAMSMLIMGWAEELKPFHIAANALWPQTFIATAAIANVVANPKMLQKCRKPDIVADAAYTILTQNSSLFSGNFCIDETVLLENNMDNLDSYAVNPTEELLKDLFID